MANILDAQKTFSKLLDIEYQFDLAVKIKMKNIFVRPSSLKEKRIIQKGKQNI